VRKVDSGRQCTRPAFRVAQRNGERRDDQQRSPPANLVEIVQNVSDADLPHDPTQEGESAQNSKAVQQKVSSVGTTSHAQRYVPELRRHKTAQEREVFAVFVTIGTLWRL